MARRLKPSLSTQLTPILLAWMALVFALPVVADAVDIVEGIYELTSRELSDGTVQKPPQILGSLTMWEGHRNVNVLSTNPAGKKQSVSIVSSYTLTNKEFVETLKFRVVTNGTSGEPPKYLVSAPAKSAPVKVQGNRVAFSPPYTRPSLVFDGNGLVSTAEGKFVDTWKKLK